MVLTLFQVLVRNKDEIIRRWAAAIKGLGGSYDAVPLEELLGQGPTSFDAILTITRDRSYHKMRSFIERVSRRRGDAGFRLGETLQAFLLFKSVVLPHLVREYAADPPTLEERVRELDSMLMKVAGEFAEQFQVVTESMRKTYVTQIDRLEQRIEEGAKKDPLTGLLNRRAFFDRIDAIASHLIQGERRPLGLVIFDLDDLQAYNRSLGSEEGDRLLIRLADVLRQYGGPEDVYARSGGGEFMVLQVGASAEAVRAFAEKVRSRQETGSEGGRATVARSAAVTVSVGAIHAPQSEMERWLKSAVNIRAELVGRAEAALLKAKQAGKNRVFLSE